MKKTLEWTHPALHLVQKALVAAVAIIAALGLLAAPVPAYADSTLSLPAPDHAKYAELDPATGKIKITLSVTGKTGASQSTTSANVIVVLDTSGSMNEVVSSSGTVHYVAEDSWRNGGQYGLVNGEYVQLTRKSSWWGYTYYYTDSNGIQVEYTDQRYKQSTDVTRLDVAKQALSNLADQLIASSDSTVKISLETFSKYGNEPSKYYGKGEAESFKALVNNTSATGGTNWADALAKANEKAAEDTSTPTYIVFLSDGKPTYGMRNGNITGNGTSDQSSSDLAQFVTDAVNTANARPDNVYGFYAIYTGSDADSSMHSFARRTNASPNGAAINGSDSTALNNEFNNIVTTIQSSISYTNVKITDPNSDVVEYVLPTGSDEPTFTYTKGGEAWSDAPAAHVVNGHQVEWDLGSLTLEQNVTYSVSFEVKLKQEAYNAAAPADGVTAVPTVDTNKAAQLAYSTVITKDGVAGEPTVQDPVAIPSPHVDVPTSKLAITKTWVGEGDKPSSITLKIKQDGHDYKTVTVQPDAAGNWATTVDVATGPDGHSYTIDEEPISGWTETTKAAGVTFKNLFTEYRDQNIENTFQSGKLTLTKKIKGNAANTSDTFKFDLSCADLKNKEFRSGNKTISFDSEGKATVDLTNSETIELNNVPAGKAIVITESSTSTPNAQMTTTATINGIETPFADSKHKSVTATVEYDKPATAVVYTNQIKIAPDMGLDISTTSQGVLLGVAAAGAATLAAAAIRKNHGERKER